MTKVYVVVEYVEYEGNQFVKVFANEKDAEAFAAELNEGNYNDSGYEFKVFEEELA